MSPDIHCCLKPEPITTVVRQVPLTILYLDMNSAVRLKAIASFEYFCAVY